jgi:His-Xaa-Ser system protein HxsD
MELKLLNMRNTMKDIITQLEDGRLLLILSKEIYEKEAVFASAHKFTDRCAILIAPIEDKSVGVYFKSKHDDLDLHEIAESFCNEVLDQQLRLDIERKYGNIRNLIVKQAFSPLDNLKDEIDCP